MNDDPQTQILRALGRSEAPLAISEIREATGRADSTIRSNLSVMSDDRWTPAWVRPYGQRADLPGRCWGLTEYGVTVAKGRGAIRQNQRVRYVEDTK